MSEEKNVMSPPTFENKSLLGRWCRAAIFALSVLGFAVTAFAGTVYVTYVTDNNAQVLSEPSSAGSVLYTPPLFGVLEVVEYESQADWLQVVTPGGEKGWILRSSVLFQEGGTGDPSSAKKGVVDRAFAKQEILKWWQTTGKNATPVCDICNARVPQDTGYMLTTQQVLGSRAYHEMLKSRAPGTYSQMIERFEHDPTPWCICEKCIEQYFMDVPGSSNPDELSKALQANKDLRKRTLEAVRSQYTMEQVRERMSGGQIWLVEDAAHPGTVYPITPGIDGWILEELEADQLSAPAGSGQ